MQASRFVFDQPLPYDEYVKWIYSHATRYRPPHDADAARLERTVQVLLATAQQSLNEGNADMAYYYAVTALQFFDAQLTGVDVRRYAPHASELMDRALAFVEAVKAGPLRTLHAQQLARIQAREPERRQIVARQLARDDNANMHDAAALLNDMQSAHDVRRQQLLQREAQHVAAFASQFATPSPAPPPAPLYSARERPPPATVVVEPTEPAPPPPSQQLVAAPPARRYEAWAFATASPMTAARRGIVNLGNTCYMNSVLQMLNCTPLADYFAQGEHRKTRACSPTSMQRCDGGSTATAQQAAQLARCYARLVCDLREHGSSYAVSASAFKRAFGAVYTQFDNYAQQDANEFLRLLLDVLHTALNPLQERASATTRHGEIDNVHGSDEAIAARYWQQYVTHNMSVVVDLCAFQERSELRCPQCGQSGRSFAPSFALELAIASSHASSSRVSLEDCLDAYCRVEVLDRDSLYLCPGCKQRVRATKQMLFYTAPDVLFVTLKRFKMLGDFTNAAKNNSAVYIPGNLDLAPYMCTSSQRGGAASSRYALVALVNHQGNMYGGHYTADCRGSDGAWAHFSDEVVSRADKPQLDLAYILCYRRIGSA